MAQSLCKVYLHIVFHIKTTSPTVATEHLERLHQYIGGLVNIAGCQVLCVGGTENHIHALTMFSRTGTIAYVVEEMKRNSSRWIKTLSLLIALSGLYVRLLRTYWPSMVTRLSLRMMSLKKSSSRRRISGNMRWRNAVSLSITD